MALRMFAALVLVYLAFAAIMFFLQRSLLYFPSHHSHSTELAPWIDGARFMGYCREVAEPRTIWLMLHGNGGQASDRGFVLSHISGRDSFYVVEYPGYGSRPGKPTRESLNQAAAEAYRLLRTRQPGVPVCVLGESLGSGPACTLAREPAPPDKIVLAVPFDSLVRVAARSYFFLPVRWMLLDNWNNVEALKGYSGPVEIYGAARDEVIPVTHAKALASQIPNARFVLLEGGHNDWSTSDQVKLKL